MRAAENGEEVQINNSLTEGVLSAIMNHPNIVRSLGYEAVLKRGTTDGATHEIRLLMEFCDRGSLDNAVSQGCFHEEYDGMLKVLRELCLLLCCRGLLFLSQNLAFVRRLPACLGILYRC